MPSSASKPLLRLPNGRQPALLGRCTSAHAKFASLATHEHLCPVVQKPVFGERYVDGTDRLCTTVTAVREQKTYFSRQAQTAINVWAG